MLFCTLKPLRKRQAWLAVLSMFMVELNDHLVLLWYYEDRQSCSASTWLQNYINQCVEKFKTMENIMMDGMEITQLTTFVISERSQTIHNCNTRQQHFFNLTLTFSCACTCLQASHWKTHQLCLNLLVIKSLIKWKKRLHVLRSAVIIADVHVEIFLF